MPRKQRGITIEVHLELRPESRGDMQPAESALAAAISVRHIARIDVAKCANHLADWTGGVDAGAVEEKALAAFRGRCARVWTIESLSTDQK